MELLTASVVGAEARVTPTLHPAIVTAVTVRWTSAGGAARRIHVAVHDAEDRMLLRVPAPGSQAGFQAIWYSLFDGAPWQLALGQPMQFMPWPARFLVPRGGYVRCWDYNDRAIADDILLVVQIEG